MSHHSKSDIPPEFLKKFEDCFSKETPKLYGEYPNGRLNKDDQGAVACAIGHEKGVVVMRFPYDLKWIGFTPEQAIEIAQLLITHSRACGCNKPLSITI